MLVAIIAITCRRTAGSSSRLSSINQGRASLGAQESGLASAAEQRSIQSLNLQEAESRIRDLDVAEAIVEQTRNEILLQGAVSALLQSNVQNTAAATLLGG